MFTNASTAYCQMAKDFYFPVDEQQDPNLVTKARFMNIAAARDYNSNRAVYFQQTVTEFPSMLRADFGYTLGNSDQMHAYSGTGYYLMTGLFPSRLCDVLISVYKVAEFCYAIMNGQIYRTTLGIGFYLLADGVVNRLSAFNDPVDSCEIGSHRYSVNFRALGCVSSILKYPVSDLNGAYVTANGRLYFFSKDLRNFYDSVFLNTSPEIEVLNEVIVDDYDEVVASPLTNPGLGFECVCDIDYTDSRSMSIVVNNADVNSDLKKILPFVKCDICESFLFTKPNTGWSKLLREVKGRPDAILLYLQCLLDEYTSGKILVLDVLFKKSPFQWRHFFPNGLHKPYVDESMVGDFVHVIGYRDDRTCLSFKKVFSDITFGRPFMKKSKKASVYWFCDSQFENIDWFDIFNNYFINKVIIVSWPSLSCLDSLAYRLVDNSLRAFLGVLQSMLFRSIFSFDLEGSFVEPLTGQFIEIFSFNYVSLGPVRPSEKLCKVVISHFSEYMPVVFDQTIFSCTRSEFFLCLLSLCSLISVHKENSTWIKIVPLRDTDLNIIVTEYEMRGKIFYVDAINVGLNYCKLNGNDKRMLEDYDFDDCSCGKGKKHKVSECKENLFCPTKGFFMLGDEVDESSDERNYNCHHLWNSEGFCTECYAENLDNYGYGYGHNNDDP